MGEIKKGIHTKVEAISAFGSDKEDTGLYDKLDSLKIRNVYCVGLCYDSTVGYTAEDAAQEGWDSYIIKDATESFDPDDEDFMNDRLKEAGAKIINSKDLPK